jgi:hypothetical protein
MIIRSKDRYIWENYYQLDDDLVTAILISGSTLYAGTSPNGKLYRINLTTNVVTLDQSVNGAVVNILIYNSEVYAATSKPATIYKFDPVNVSWVVFYEPYGSSINQMSTFSNKIYVAMDAKNIVAYDGSNWSIEVSQPDNMATTRRVSKNVFSHVSYDFLDTKSIAVTDGMENEDILDIFPYNRLVGVGSFTVDGVTMTIGGKNFGRVFNYNGEKLSPIFETDTQGVQFLLNLDTGANLAAMDDKLYLVHCGDISAAVAEVPEEVTEDPNAGKTVVITSPNGGEILVIGQDTDITWSSTRGVNDAVKLALYQAGEEILVISERTINDGIFTWNVPISLSDGSDYQIYIEWLTAGTPAEADTDLSDANFSILFTAPTVESISEESVLPEGTPDFTLIMAKELLS